MPRCVCAVFDDSIDYINRFLGYTGKKRDLLFEVSGFTKREALDEFLVREGADILLFSEDSLSKGDFESSLKAAEEKCEVAMLADPKTCSEKYRCINMYQSMEDIISDVTELLKESEKLSEKRIRAFKTPEIIGIYSFGHLDEAERFALNISRGSAEQKKALYLNLNRFSGLLKNDGSEGSMSDVIYYYKTGCGKIRGALSRALGHIGTIDVLTGPENLEDLDQLSEEDWPHFLSVLAEYFETERVVVDIGEAFRDMRWAIRMCSRIYLIADRTSDMKRISAFRRYLEGMKEPAGAKKVTEVDVSREGEHGSAGRA